MNIKLNYLIYTNIIKIERYDFKFYKHLQEENKENIGIFLSVINISDLFIEVLKLIVLVAI